MLTSPLLSRGLAPSSPFLSPLPMAPMGALDRLMTPMASAPAMPTMGDPMVMQMLVQMLSSLMMGQSLPPEMMGAMNGAAGFDGGMGGISGGGGGGTSGASGYSGGYTGGSSSSSGSSGVSSSGGGGGSAPVSGGGVTDSGPVAKGTAGMLERAGSMVGMTEGGNTAEIQAITGKSGINPASTPWCAAYAINLMKDHGVLDTTGLSNPNYCPTIADWAASKGLKGERGSYTPKAGDAILFDWGGDGTEDHIGLVEKVKDGKVYTIEGNSSDSVKRNVYELNDGNIAGYVKSSDPKGTKDKLAPTKTPAPTPKTPPADSKKK